MKNPDMIKRYTMFMAGVIASALGISLITKAGLGTSPVTSPAFVLTFLFPFSLGTFTMMVNTLMFGLQAVILGRDFERVQLLLRHCCFRPALTGGAGCFPSGRCALI